MIGVATQYVGDIIGNIVSGKKGFEILSRTSSPGEYLAAGLTALIPGSGLLPNLTRNIVSESICYVEREINGGNNDIVVSGFNIIQGMVIDSTTNKLINKVDDIIMSTAPKNYSTFANKLYNRKPNISINEIKSKMYRSIRWKKRISDLIGFTIDSFSTTIDWR